MDIRCSMVRLRVLVLLVLGCAVVCDDGDDDDVAAIMSFKS